MRDGWVAKWTCKFTKGFGAWEKGGYVITSCAAGKIATNRVFRQVVKAYRTSQQDHVTEDTWSPHGS